MHAQLNCNLNHKCPPMTELEVNYININPTFLSNYLELYVST